MLAAKNGQETIVALLLNRKADPDVADAANRTALLYAVSGEHEEIVKLLVAKGAKTDYTDRSGVSPLTLVSTHKDQPNPVVLLTRFPPTK